MTPIQGAFIIIGILSFLGLCVLGLIVLFQGIEFIKRKEVIDMEKSKTIIFNVIALIVAVASGFGFVDFKPSIEITALAGGIVALINIYLRLRKLPPDQESIR